MQEEIIVAKIEKWESPPARQNRVRSNDGGLSLAILVK